MSRISQSEFVRHFRVIHWENQEVERVVAREGRPELQEKVDRRVGTKAAYGRQSCRNWIRNKQNGNI